MVKHKREWATVEKFTDLRAKKSKQELIELLKEVHTSMMAPMDMANEDLINLKIV